MGKEKKRSFWQNLPLDEYFTTYNKLLDSAIGKRLNLRKFSENFIYQGTKNGMRASAAIGKIFEPSDKSASRFTTKSTSDYFDLNYTEEQLLVQESVKEFALKLRAAAQEQDENKHLTDDIKQAYQELQLHYLQVPESLGGFGNEKSTVTQMLILENLAYGDLGQAYALYASNSMLNALVQWGNEAQQAALIPELLNDVPNYAGIAINESEPLFSPFELKTSAIEDGDVYVLNGKKSLIPFAEKCDYFLVAAKTSNGGEQLFLVDAALQGISIKKNEAMGLKAAELGDLHLSNVRIDKSAKLGGENGINYQEFIQYAKLGWCALAVGCCQAVLDYVINYSNERFAFGEPISNRQAVAFMIADMKIELDSMRILMQRAAAQAEHGQDFSKAVYLAHVFCGDKAMQIGTNGVQLLGGHGYIKDFPVERWYRDLRAIAILFNSMHL